MDNIEYIEGGKELLHLVQPLWDKLNKYHIEKSDYFSDRFLLVTFAEREDQLTSEMNIALKVTLARDNDQNLYIGYCVSTVHQDMTGEIESIYIDEAYRKHGIGNQLILRALKWLDINKVISKKVVVAGGNEEVLKFYNQFGFQTRKVILEQV